MASSELSGPFHLGFEQRQPTIEFPVIFFAIRNRCDKKYPVCQKHYHLWGLCLFSACIASGFFFWDLPNVEAVDWSDMGLSIPGLSAILRPFPAREKWMAISHCSYICMIEQSGSKDPYAAFGGNMAALQQNQVTVVGLKTHMPPLAEIWLLCSVSSVPVAQMQNLVVFQNRSASNKIVTVSIYCDEITNVTDGHVSDESHKYRWSKNSI